MKRLFRHGKLVLLTMVLAVVSLTVAGMSPAAHAATTATTPTITTSVTFFSGDHSEEATLNVQGVNFTPLGSVTVEVFDSAWHLVSSRTITASGFDECHPGLGGRPVCTGGGAFYAGFLYAYPPFPVQPYHVIAYDSGSGRWSNWSSQSI